MRIYLYFIGKARDASANGMAAEYIKRASRYGRCEMREIHPERFDVWAKHPSSRKILLDPAGKLLNSAPFTDSIASGEPDARDLGFCIGGGRWLPEPRSALPGF